MRVILFGGSAGTGLQVAHVLEDEAWDVAAFVRPTSNRAPLEPLGVSFIEGDATDRASVDAAFAGREFDAVVCTVGTKPGGPITDLQTNRNIIDAARAAGVRRIVLLTTIGAGDSWDSVAEGARRFLGEMMKEKTRIEEYLAGSGLDWTILRPGGLKDAHASGTAIMTEDHTVAGYVNRADVACCVADCLLDESTIGRIYHVVDPRQPYALSA